MTPSRPASSSSSLAALFTVTAVKIAFGDTIVATSAPPPSAGYPFLVLTFVGWGRTLLAPDESPAAPEGVATMT